MNKELELKMTEWLSNECATEHPLDKCLYYEFVFTSLEVGKKVDQEAYESMINSYREYNPLLSDEWVKKHSYNLYEELYCFGKFIQRQLN